jgi:hypothetical protein
LIRRLLRHRNAAVLPILALFLATVIGGWVNTIDLHGRVVDDFTDQGLINASLTHGSRVVGTDINGVFDFPSLPRQSKMRVDVNGYLRTSVPTTQEEIRMAPTSWTVLIIEAGNPDKHIAKADIRQGTTVLATSTDTVNTIVQPHPGRNAKVTVCAEGYQTKEVDVRGVLQTIELTPGGTGCPPLPSPSPTASPRPTASGSPAASPSASPSTSPSPSPSP